MELIDHGDLGNYLLQRGPRPENEARDIAHQVLSGLKVMHDYGITHRDLKPAVRVTLPVSLREIPRSGRVRAVTLLKDIGS